MIESEDIHSKMDIQDVFESTNSVSKEDQFIFTESQLEAQKRKITFIRMEYHE